MRQFFIDALALAFVGAAVAQDPRAAEPCASSPAASSSTLWALPGSARP